MMRYLVKQRDTFTCTYMKLPWTGKFMQQQHLYHHSEFFIFPSTCLKA